MTAALKRQLLSVEDYLAGELASTIKHEYVGGLVHAMAGASNRHSLIAGNIHGALRQLLKGKRCQAFSTDTKVRVPAPPFERYYYPDCTVTCDPNPLEDSFQDKPVVIFEVLSERTRATDEREKFEAYLSIPSLALYALVEQEQALVTVFRRTPTGFVREIYEGLASILPLPEVECELPLSEAYERVEFFPGRDDDEGS